MSKNLSPTSKAQCVATYLREELAGADGPMYVKSRFIAEDLSLSAKEIGASMRRLSDEDGDLAIEPWSYTGATTWRVSLDS